MLIFILIAILVVVVLSFTQTPKLGPTHCEKQHKWVIRFNEHNDKRGYLVCKACGKIPGEDHV